MEGVDFIFQIAVLIMSVVVHEVSHGYAAYMLGDKTAKYAGRLTLNPVKHLDPIGSFLLPVITYLTAGFIFGWAKPVPYNPYNLKNQRWGEAWVAIAGPLSNIFIALVFGLVVRFGTGLSESFIAISSIVVFLNIILAVFNLIPIAPLDGSKILYAILPQHISMRVRESYERFGFFLIIFVILFFWRFIIPIVMSIFTLFTGIGF